MEKSLEANKKDIDIAQYELDCYDQRTESPNEESNGQTPDKSEVERNFHTTQSNGASTKRRLSNSSISGDENAVNTFEGTFLV